MKQLDTDLANKLTYEARPNKPIFLAGENGTGKSRLLEEIARNLYLNEDNKIIAISNSSYTRFPSRRFFRKDNYHRYLSGMKNNTPSRIVKNIFSSSTESSDNNTLHELSRTLDYLDIDSEIGFSIDLRNQFKDIYDYNQHSSTTDYRKSRNSNYLKNIDIEINRLINELYFDENIKSNYPYIIDLLQNLLNSKEDIHWIEISKTFQSFSFDLLSALIKIESKLGKNLQLSIYCKKKDTNSPFLLDGMSSGEKSLFNIFQFISSNIGNNSWILIDEPENSLHPKWQRAYCRSLIDRFDLYEPKIIIATHSPMIISGASISKDADKIYTPNSSTAYDIEDTEGVEALLMEVFDTVMPKNHHLSIKAQQLLEDFSNEKISELKAINIIQKWKKQSTEKNQINFLEDLKKLAVEISKNKKLNDINKKEKS